MEEENYRAEEELELIKQRETRKSSVGACGNDEAEMNNDEKDAF